MVASQTDETRRTESVKPKKPRTKEKVNTCLSEPHQAAVSVVGEAHLNMVGVLDPLTITATILHQIMTYSLYRPPPYYNHGLEVCVVNVSSHLACV